MRLVFLVLFASSLAQAQAVLVDRVVASVQSHAITRSMVDLRVKQGIKDRTEARDMLIEELLISLDSSRLGLTVSPEEVDRALEEIAKTNKLTQEELLKALNEQGYELPSYREALKQQLLSMRWVLRRAAAENMPTEPMERATFMEAARKRYLEQLRRENAVEVREVQP